MKFHFSIAAWGDAFLDVFMRIHLPSLLSPGNLPGFLEKYPLEYRIYTTPEDAIKIQSSEIYKNFSRAIPTEIITVADLDFSDVDSSHRVFNDLMRMAMRDAVDCGANIIMNNPDTCWGDGSFRHIAELISAGKKAILNSAIRTDSHKFIDEVYGKYSVESNGALIISNPDLVKIGLNSIHPYQSTTVWGQQHSSLMPSPVITPIMDEGYILNMAHMGSLVVISDDVDQDFQTTTDGDYISCVFENYSDIHVLKDSDNVCVMELSSSGRYVNNIIFNVPLNEYQIAHYLCDTASWKEYSLYNFGRNLRYHWKPVTEGIWQEKEIEVRQRNDAILNCRQLMLWMRKLEEKGTYDWLCPVINRASRNISLLYEMGDYHGRSFVVPHTRDLMKTEQLLRSIDADEDDIARHIVFQLISPKTNAEGRLGEGHGSETDTDQVEDISIEYLKEGALDLTIADIATGVVDNETLPLRCVASIRQKTMIYLAILKMWLAFAHSRKSIRHLYHYAQHVKMNRHKSCQFDLSSLLKDTFSISLGLLIHSGFLCMPKSKNLILRYFECPTYIGKQIQDEYMGTASSEKWLEYARFLAMKGNISGHMNIGQSFFSEFEKPEKVNKSNREFFNVALYAYSKACSFRKKNLANNALYYFEMGQLLYTNNLFDEAKFCFLACTYLSPAFEPSKEYIDRTNRILFHLSKKPT